MCILTFAVPEFCDGFTWANKLRLKLEKTDVLLIRWRKLACGASGWRNTFSQRSNYSIWLFWGGGVPSSGLILG